MSIYHVAPVVVLHQFLWVSRNFFLNKEVRNATEAHIALMRGSPYVPRTLQMQLKENQHNLKIAVGPEEVWVRSSAWPFFPSFLHFFLFISSNSHIRSWDVELYIKFQPHTVKKINWKFVWKNTKKITFWKYTNFSTEYENS